MEASPCRARLGHLARCLSSMRAWLTLPSETPIFRKYLFTLYRSPELTHLCLRKLTHV